MNGIIYNYIIQAILGGASGYITNDYAINMLFKEYTPFKIGGVIKKTRSEFISNLSSLVENDIINKDKLHDILTDESFKDKFESLTEDFFKNCLYDSIGFNQFAKIDGIDSSINSCGDFLNNILDNNMVEIIDLLFENLKIDVFLTPTQLEKISNTLFDSIYNLANSSNVVEELLSSAYSEYKSNKIINLLNGTDNSIYTVTENFIHKLNQVITDRFSDKTIDVIKDVSKATEFDNALISVKEMLYEKSFKDIIVIDEQLRINIIKSFKKYIHSNNGQNAILELCNSLFSYVKKYDKTLFNLIDTSFEVNLKSYLVENLPSLTEQIIKWITINSNNIDKIIEDSVGEIIEESDGMKGILLNTIKGSYLDNLTEKYNIIQKIIDYVQKETEPEKLSSDISSKIINYLNNISISEMLISAENYSIITPSISTKYLTEYLDAYFETIFNDFSNYLMNLKLKDVLPAEINSGNIIKEKVLNVIVSKILSSKNISNSLSEKLHLHLNVLLSKNLDKLIIEGDFEKSIPNIKDFVTKTLNKNSDPIKMFIENSIKNNLRMDKIKETQGYTNVPSLISVEILKKYYTTAEELKDKNLSLGIDKINSIDNLYKNSSEMLRTLMINNLDTLLGGSVKSIVTENLNKLNDDELSNLANDFIGRELKPIMYFGGILGTGAGITLALFQNAPINPVDINIATMITYSLVGFSTNAIAINMIFKPYKEIKSLSKIPFLRNFSLGYIVKNKKVFAENMSFFIDKHLLSKESINELFSQYEGDLKINLINSIESNNYLVLNNIFTNNQESIVSGTYGFTKNLLAENTKHISNFALYSLDNYNLSTILSPSAVHYLSDFAKDSIENSKGKLEEFIINRINSTTPLENQIPDYLLNIMYNYVSNLVEKYYDITNKNLESPDNVKNFMLKYNKKYTSSSDISLGKIFKSIEIQQFNQFITYRLHQMILSEHSRKKISDTIINLFNKSMGGDNTFGELFNGKLKDFINNNIPLLFNKISNSIKNNIIGSRSVLSNSVQNEIKGSLGFLQKGMYSMMGGDEIVDQLITKIVVDKIPKFIDDKEYELLNVFINIMDEKFYSAKVDVLQSGISKIQINEMVDTYVSNSENAEMIWERIENTVSLVENKLEKFNLRDILKLLSLQNINSIFDSYGEEINKFNSFLSRNMSDNRESVINTIKLFVTEIINDFNKSASLKDLFNGISVHDVEIITNNLMNIINHNDFLSVQLNKLINDYKSFIVNRDNVSNFIDKDEFIKSSELFIKSIINSKETEKVIKNIYSSILKDSTDLNFNFIDKATKSYILNIFVESSIESVKRNLDTILKAIEFDRIAREEIDAMEPKKIHEMFNSFADKYFRRLMLYGLGGFVFGINTYIGLILSGLAAINKKFNKS
jgi:uncharacterized membrane protein YheB (UPF0754 family)